MEITSGDFLAGGGGVTLAMRKHGLKVKWVLNHDQIAIRTNMHNKKEQTRLIGNAVPPQWAQMMIEPVIDELQQILEAEKTKVV